MMWLVVLLAACCGVLLVALAILSNLLLRAGRQRDAAHGELRAAECTLDALTELDFSRAESTVLACNYLFHALSDAIDMMRELQAFVPDLALGEAGSSAGLPVGDLTSEAVAAFFDVGSDGTAEQRSPPNDSCDPDHIQHSPRTQRRNENPFSAALAGTTVVSDPTVPTGSPEGSPESASFEPPLQRSAVVASFMRLVRSDSAVNQRPSGRATLTVNTQAGTLAAVEQSPSFFSMPGIVMDRSEAGSPVHRSTTQVVESPVQTSQCLVEAPIQLGQSIATTSQGQQAGTTLQDGRLALSTSARPAPLPASSFQDWRSAGATFSSAGGLGTSNWRQWSALQVLSRDPTTVDWQQQHGDAGEKKSVASSEDKQGGAVTDGKQQGRNRRLSHAANAVFLLTSTQGQRERAPREPGSPMIPPRQGFAKAASRAALTSGSSAVLLVKNASVMHAFRPAGSNPGRVGRFVSEVSSLAESHEGTMLHIGAEDIILSWNTSRANPLHCFKAAQCAVDFSADPTPPGHAPRSCGVSTGRVHVGIAGTRQRAMVAHGLPLLIARRLRLLCQVVGAGALCDEATRSAASAVPSRIVDCVCVDPEAAAQGAAPEATLVFQLMRRAVPDHGYVSGVGALLTKRYNEAVECFCQHMRHQRSDMQALRLLKLAFFLRAELTPLPDGYVRAWQGWEGWERRANGVVFSDEIAALLNEAERRLSAQLSAQLSTHKTGLRAMLRSDEELLREQISEMRRTSDHRGSERADSGVPACVTDQQGRVWYRSDQPLGKGAFGEVWLGMSAEGAMVAMKSLQLPRNRGSPPQAALGEGPRQSAAARRRQHRAGGAVQDTGERTRVIEELLKEVALMVQLRHENVVSYLGSAVDGGYVLIVMEYCSGGSLHGVLARFGHLPPPSVRRYTSDILKGLQFLHSKDIVHRDLKPHNVLVHVEGLAKLADFGASAELKGRCDGTATGIIGTPHYMAPEACRGEASKASDVWGVGVVICQLLSGSLPWPAPDGVFNPHQFMYRLGHDPTFVPEVPDHIPEDARRLVLRCLQHSHEDRPTAEELQKDRWILS